MELVRIKNLYSYIKKYHEEEETIKNRQIDCSKLRPTLRNYQENAVKWMLQKEQEYCDVIDLLGFDVQLPSGGILADEMGLGKTVEVIACILNNPYTKASEEDEQTELSLTTTKRIIRKKLYINSKGEMSAGSESDGGDDEYKVTSMKSRKRKRSSKPQVGIYSERRKALRRMYEMALEEMSTTRRSSASRQSAVEKGYSCFCDSKSLSEIEVVQCEQCSSWQHVPCSGLENLPKDCVYKCSNCWTSGEPLPVKTTLIITPPSILNQWENELEKHVDDPDLNVLIYQGVRGQFQYTQPSLLATYDIVITTYSVLCSELNYSQDRGERHLRYSKRYTAPNTPLTCLLWWRICLDEAQMVQGYTSKTAIMAGQLDAVHRWGVTGTPIQKSITDLFGLVSFLHLDPFCSDMSLWTELLSQEALLHRLCARLLWRNSKSDVLSALQVPPQTLLTHWLHFSPVEGYFYRTIHSECAAAFRFKLFRFHNLDIKLSSIDRTVLTSLLLPLLRVRQACTHPQVVRGKFVRFKHTMTMEELMNQMVVKARSDADIALRQLVSSVNGIAAIKIIEHEWCSAAENYRRVLQLSVDYKDTIKVDSVQMIHALHNLSEVLDGHGAGIPPTLRDGKLKEEAQALEESYLQKYERILQSAKEGLRKVTRAIVAQGGAGDGNSLEYTCWWEEVLNTTDNEEELLSRIRSYIEDNLVPGQQSITPKLSSLQTVLRELGLWLASADSLRQDALRALEDLEKQPTASVCEAAFLCHVPPYKRQKRSRRCRICQTEAVLKKYEAHIFSVNKQNLTVGDSDDEKEEIIPENKNVAELQDVKIFTTRKESSWKPTSQERIIHVLANHVKNRKINPEWSEDAPKHLTLLETVRKEFRWIRAVWRNISDQVYARDELAMAKLRLRLPTYDEEFEKKKNSLVIKPYEVPFTLLKLQNECVQAEAALKRTSGTLFYMQNLQKNGGSEQEPCPVCKESLTEKWSVLHCGHCFCFDCIPSLLKMGGSEIDCPLCRVKTPKEDVSYVVAKPSEYNDTDSVQVKGSHSTKVRAVVVEMLTLLREDPNVKVLIFSTWEKVLDIIGDAFHKNEISCRRLGTGEKFKNSLTQFKTGPVSALLLPLKLGAKGLNLTEARHLFFVEPVLNPAEEQQAIGRIHRIGQTKPTFVHRFVLHNTIEERMLTSLESSSKEEWSQENVTLRKLNDLFILSDEMSSGGGSTSTEDSTRTHNHHNHPQHPSHSSISDDDSSSVYNLETDEE